MSRHAAESEQQPGSFCGETSFDAPVLRHYRFPCFEIRGRKPGPRLCVMAGVHVNEVSSIEAAIRLRSLLPPDALAGNVSVIPVVNQPALYEYTQYNCPVDGKNILFNFPGRPDGSFSEALCHALLFEWAADADVLVDMHGGDLRENVAKFVMFQRTGDPELDARRESMAKCFDADLVVGFDPSHMDRPGRSLTALAKMGRSGVMSEAGANGVVDEGSVRYHTEGVLNLARLLGMLEGTPTRPTRPQRLCHRYIWVRCPVDGLFHAVVEPNEPVVRGQRLGEMSDLFGRVLGEVVAPESGYVLWRMTHPVLKEGAFALGLAVPAS
jgi:predicted deacylase